MSFANPEGLWLLLAAPIGTLLALWLWRRQLLAMSRWAATSLWDRLEVRYRPHRLSISMTILGLAILGTTLGLAAPRWGIIEQRVDRQGVDVVFVLDSSLSMRTRDVAPSRMEIAKAMVRRMIQALPGHRAALVQTEGKGVVLSPLTVDTAVIDLLLDTVFAGSLPDPGTRFDSALQRALDLYPPEGEKHRVLVLVSDGEDHGSNWKAALGKLADAGVVVHALGIGTRQGSPIELTGERAGPIRYKQDSQGKTVVSKLHPEILAELASTTGGRFVEVSSPAVEPTPIIDSINAMKTRTLEGETLDVAAERFQWPLAIAAAATALYLVFPPLVPSPRQGASAR